MQILPPDVETDKLSGFKERDEAKKPSVINIPQTAGSSSALDGQHQQMAATVSSAKSITPFDALS